MVQGAWGATPGLTIQPADCMGWWSTYAGREGRDIDGNGSLSVELAVTRGVQTEHCRVQRGGSLDKVHLGWVVGTEHHNPRCALRTRPELGAHRSHLVHRKGVKQLRDVIVEQALKL